MNILEIDAVNFAGRVGHVAAAELAGLLNHGEVRPEVGWFAGELGAEAGAALGERIDGMAGYVLQRQCSGETLYRAHGGAMEWQACSPWMWHCYDLFVVTVLAVGSRLLAEQRWMEAAHRQAAQANAPLKLEDSIFEREESLGTLRPEAVAAAAQMAAHEAASKAEARTRRRLQEARRRAERAAASVAEAEQAHGAAAAELSSTPAPMSVGEAPAKPPVNRGGRGRKKAE